MLVVRNHVGDLATYRILAWKGLPRSTFGNQRHIRIGAVCRAKIAPRNQRNLHGRQIVLVDPAQVDHRALRLRHGVVRPLQVVYPGLARQRHGAGHSHRLHAWQLLQSRQRAIRKGQFDRLHIGHLVAELRREQIHLSHRHMAGIEAAILAQQARKTAQHQGCDHEQNHRAGDLSRNQHTACAPSLPRTDRAR